MKCLFYRQEVGRYPEEDVGADVFVNVDFWFKNPGHELEIAQHLGGNQLKTLKPSRIEWNFPALMHGFRDVPEGTMFLTVGDFLHAERYHVKVTN